MKAEASRLVVLISGSGSNLQAIIEGCRDGQIAASVSLVVSNRAAAYGLTRAQQASIATAYLPRQGRERRDYDAALADVVAAAKPDWVVLAGWMHILTSAFLDRFPGRVVNLHPALPGEFPGAHAIDDALAAHHERGLERTGVMVHLVPDEKVDVGPVLASVEVSIIVGDDLDSLSERIRRAEHRLFVDVLAQLCRQPQPSARAGGKP